MLNPRPNNKESFSHFNDNVIEKMYVGSRILGVGFSQKLDNDSNCYYIIVTYAIFTTCTKATVLTLSSALRTYPLSGELAPRRDQ